MKVILDESRYKFIVDMIIFRQNVFIIVPIIIITIR